MALTNKQQRMKKLWSEGRQVPPSKCKGNGNMKFGKEAKPPIYTIQRPHHKTSARKNRDKWDEARVGRSGNLSHFDLAAGAREVVEQAKQDIAKAHAQCLCTHRTIDGKRWSVMSPDCPSHGTFKENLRFSQGKEKVPIMRRKGVTSY